MQEAPVFNPEHPGDFLYKRGTNMQLELNEQEAQAVDDVLGMWLDGMDESIPELTESDENAVWQLYRLREHKEIVSRVRLRIQLERRDNVTGHTRRMDD